MKMTPARGSSAGHDKGGPEHSAVFVGRNGYTPCAHDELLDHRVSGDELQLLLLARYTSDRDETDGFISERQMKALAVMHDIGPARLEKAIRGLIRKSRLQKKRSGFFDVGFENVCRSAAERTKLRENWRRWKGASRGSMSGPDTIPESGPESGRVSAASPSPSPSPSYSPSPSDGQPLTRHRRAAKAAGTKRGEPRGVGEPPDEDLPL